MDKGITYTTTTVSNIIDFDTLILIELDKIKQAQERIRELVASKKTSGQPQPWFPVPPAMPTLPPPQPWVNTTQCAICGTSLTSFMGYVCPNPACPGKVVYAGSDTNTK